MAGKEAEGEGHGIEQEGATLNRFATTIIGAEITGMFITEDGRFFFNVQHPDANLDGEDEPGILGAVTGVDMNQLPRDFQSVQIPEGDDDDYSDDGDGVPEPYDKRVRTALGDYQRLAVGGDETDDGEELGSVYTPEGDSLTGQINPDFNGYVPSSEEPDEGYLFTNWEHRPGAMTRVHLQQNGRNGTWRVLGMENLDFSAVEGTWVNCFGTVSPWGTPLTSEENYSIPDTPVWNNPDWQYKGGVERLARHLGHERNDDGIFADKFPNPYRYGYIVELNEPESEEPVPEKRFALGRSTHENAVVMPDEKTAYTTSDGTARGFYKFVADEKGDLSSGTLYAAKATQDGPLGGDPDKVSFGIEWIELGHASDDQIEEWIAEYDEITQADYEEGENSYITDAEMDAWAVGDADDDRVAFLQCRQAAMRKGATTEFRKMEGINIRRDAEAGEDYMYVAMSNTNRTMGDDEGDIQLNGDEWGAVYRMPLESDYDISEMEPIVTGGPEANICGGCPYDANPNANDKACQSCAFNPTKDDEDQGRLKGTMNLAKSMAMSGQTSLDPENTIAEPDNIVVMDDGRVVIGEDTGNRGHENNMIWVFDPGSA
ncbi:alkaline phosphatase PhoX [Halorubrum sp. N11]|uniref:alkaline phosphatase PhoX n=1 Tax=Halorubrum sp. N11 TaxID=3402276 RepID=UPI003EBB5AE0